MLSNHAKHMLLGGAAILGLLLLARVPLGTAVSYAVLLACPPMMAMMMWSMGRTGAHGSRPGPHEDHELRSAQEDEPNAAPRRHPAASAPERRA